MFLILNIAIAVGAAALLIFSHITNAYRGYPRSLYWRARLLGLGVVTGIWGMWSCLGYDTSRSSIMWSLILGGLLIGPLSYYALSAKMKTVIPKKGM